MILKGKHTQSSPVIYHDVSLKVTIWMQILRSLRLTLLAETPHTPSVYWNLELGSIGKLQIRDMTFREAQNQAIVIYYYCFLLFLNWSMVYELLILLVAIDDVSIIPWLPVLIIGFMIPVSLIIGQAVVVFRDLWSGCVPFHDGHPWLPGRRFLGDVKHFERLMM